MTEENHPDRFKTYMTESIIHTLILIFLIFIARQIYKIDKFKNKFMAALIFSLIISLSSDAISRSIEAYRANNNTESNIIDNLAYYQHFFEYIGDSSMQISLVINLRIWTCYLFKIWY